MDRQSVLVWVLLVIVGAILCIVGWYRFIAHAQEHGAWRDPSPHHVHVMVEDGVRLEVLDWGGRGRPMCCWPDRETPHTSSMNSPSSGSS